MCSPKEQHQKKNRTNDVCASKNTLKPPPRTIFKKGGGVQNPPRYRISQKPRPSVQHNVEWDVAKQFLQDSNALLSQSPDRMPQRIARPVRLPLDWDIDKSNTLTYVMCRPYPPYVGQTGCVKGVKSLFTRYCEHLRAARSCRPFSGAFKPNNIMQFIPKHLQRSFFQDARL